MKPKSEVRWTFAEVCPLMENSSVHAKELYSMLEERLKHPEWNISHKEMPTYEQHLNFIYSDPYWLWYIIVNAYAKEQVIGTVYFTNDYEIGIYIREGFQEQGYGKDVLSKFLEVVNPMSDEIYANINPKNTRSIKLFEKFGFEYKSDVLDLDHNVLQVVYSKSV